MSASRLTVAGACLLAGLALPCPAPAAPADSVGRSIYLRGVLGSGAPLEGTREAGVVTTGADVACVNCHQRSGFGSVEGGLSIPPVVGEYLFHSRVQDPSEPVLPHVESLHGNRDPYTDATLARAIREGRSEERRVGKECRSRW